MSGVTPNGKVLQCRSMAALLLALVALLCSVIVSLSWLVCISWGNAKPCCGVASPVNPL